MKKNRNAKIDKLLFSISSIFITTIIILMIIYESKTKDMLNEIFNFTTNQLGWIYIWGGIFSFFLCLWFAFGKYGKVKLGGPDAIPDFKTSTWVAMFFCSGIGTSVLVWGTKEWYYYYLSPPFGIESMTAEAASYASMYPMFHWGPLGWGIYCILAFPIGYAYWNRKETELKLSTACGGVIGEKNSAGLFGKFIDFLLLFGLIGGVATSIAVGTPMLGETISKVFNIQHTSKIDVLVIVIWTIIFTTSVTLGLKRGIKVLSDINVCGVLILCTIIIIVGPTWFLINTYTDSIGLMINNFFRMSFYTDPINKSNFPQAWTVFYWAWWYAYAPFMGIFIARISKGRTFKEIALGVIFGGSFGCSVFFGIFGNNALHQQLTGKFNFIEVAQNSGDAAAILGSLMNLPGKALILGMFLFVGFVYLATTIDSAAYIMATVTSKIQESDQEPVWWNRMFWAIMLGVIGLVVMNLGGLIPLKTTSIIVAFPILILSIMAVISLIRWLENDKPHIDKK